MKIKEIGGKFTPINESERFIIVFDVTLGASTSKYIDQFFIGGRHNKLDILHLSQSYFILPKRSRRNSSNKKNLPNQTLKDLDYIYIYIYIYIIDG